MPSATRASSRGSDQQTLSASNHVNYMSANAVLQILPRLYSGMLENQTAEKGQIREQINQLYSEIEKLCLFNGET